MTTPDDAEQAARKIILPSTYDKKDDPCWCVPYVEGFTSSLCPTHEEIAAAIRQAVATERARGKALAEAGTRLANEIHHIGYNIPNYWGDEKTRKLKQDLCYDLADLWNAALAAHTGGAT